MGKPTLLGVEGQAQEIIEKYHAGLCFVPEDENDFISKVLLLKNDVYLYRDCVDGCKVLANEYDRKILASKMLSILIEVLEEYK